MQADTILKTKMIKIKIKKIIQLTTLTISLMYFTYCIFHFIFHEQNPKYLDCGNVISKSSDEITIKYGINTKLYLNIQFNKSGFRSIECTPTKYFSANIGQNMCFDLYKTTNTWYDINHTVGFITIFILCIIIIVLFINYLIPNSWKEED